MLRCVLLLLAIAVCSVSSAQKQTRPNYKLLWKISGNGLKKPSYLFGTMHVQDKKAFDFSDSVLLKLEECEAFALEVHPDSITAFMMQALLDQSRQQEDFEGTMSGDEFERLDSLMKKKTGFSLKRFSNPRQANIFLKERAKAKEASTFLDAWLYNVARNQNKTMLGLEEYSAQLDLLKNSVEEKEELKSFLESSSSSYESAYKSLLNLYYTGDVDAIRQFSIRSTDDENYSKMITKRNVIMSETIQKEIHRHSTFIAVGAAHLAGEEGVINLLQNAGYEVRPVTATFTGVAGRYKVVKTEQKWFPFDSSDGGYSLDMPQKPIPFAPPQVPITFQTSVDIGTLTVYLATHFPLGSKITSETSAKTLDQFEKNVSGKSRIYSRKNFKVEGHDGRELELTMNDHYFRIQIILRESMVYLLMCGPTKEVARSEDANRFFASFKTSEMPQQVSEDFVHEEAAFSIRMPGKVTSRKLSPPDPSTGRLYKINMFMSASTKTGETYIFRYNDFPPGLVSINDSLYFANTLQVLVENMKAHVISKHDVVVEGFPAKQFSFSMPMDQTSTGDGLMVLRGNRFYLALTVRGASSSRDGVDQYFRSLRFLPYQHTPAKTLTVSEGVSLKVPVGFETDSAFNKTESSTEYSFLDKNSGIHYTLMAEKFSKYDEADDTTAYFDRVIENFKHEGDSTLSSESFQGPGYFGFDYSFGSSVVNTTRRVKVVAVGSRFYSLSSFLPKDYSQSTFSDEVFNSFSVKPDTDWNLFSDKSDLILEDLTSADSIVKEDALAALRVKKFDVSYLPKIYQRILLKYSDPDFEERVKNALIAKLGSVHNETTLPFLVQLYGNLNDTTDARDFALRALTSMKSEESVRTMVNIIRQDSTDHVFNNYMVLNPLNDSLQLLENHLSDILSLESRFENNYTLFNLVKLALDSGLLTTETKAKVIGQVLELGNKIVQKSIGEKDQYGVDRVKNQMYYLATLLTSLPFSQEVKSLMVELQRKQDISIMAMTSVFLLKNNVPVSSADIDKIAQDPEYRFDLYEDLNEIGKGSLMNKKYKSLRMLAESDFYQTLLYSDEIADRVEFVEERKISLNGKTQSLYVFRYAFDESDEWSMGVSGPYDPKAKGMIPRGNLSDVFYENYPDNKSLTERLKKFVEENGGKLLK